MEKLLGYFYGEDNLPDSIMSQLLAVASNSNWEKAKYDEQFTTLNPGSGFEPSHLSRFRTFVVRGDEIEIFVTQDEFVRCTRINAKKSVDLQGILGDYYPVKEVWSAEHKGGKYPFFGSRHITLRKHEA